MLTLEDCFAFSELTEDEIAAIAEHEHLPELAALELGNYLIHLPDGAVRIRRMILDDIEAAKARGDALRALKLKLVLRHFCDCHREALRGAAPLPDPAAAPA